MTHVHRDRPMAHDLDAPEYMVRRGLYERAVRTSRNHWPARWAPRRLGFSW
jgi:hypothetical protein